MRPLYNVGGIPKIVRENGAMCAPGDVEGFSKKIIEFLSDDEKLLRAGQESLNIVKKDYSLEKHLKQISNVYEEVTKGEI